MNNPKVERAIAEIIENAIDADPAGLPSGSDTTDQTVVAARAGLLNIPTEISGHPLISTTIYEADSSDWLVEILWGKPLDIFGLYVAPLPGEDSDEVSFDAFGVLTREIVKDGILMSLKVPGHGLLQRFQIGLLPVLTPTWASEVKKPVDPSA